MRPFRITALLCLATALTAPALAQTTPTTGSGEALSSTDPARAPSALCLEDLDGFARQMNQDGFWVVGWGNRYAQPGTPVSPGADAGAGGAATGADAATMPGNAFTASPWAGISGVSLGSPRTQIRELYGAAHVLAYLGETEGCQYVVSLLDTIYQNYVGQLHEAGVAPEDVTGWRQEQLALAQPVGEMLQQGRTNVDDLTGTDVRTTSDEMLGSISDLIIDPNSGQVTYAIVARGGFLGIGEDHVAVPWAHFRATPGLNTLVLDTTQEAFEAAPVVDPDAFADPDLMRQQDEDVDAYWTDQGTRVTTG